MLIIDTMTKLETQVAQLEKAQAVLIEATRHHEWIVKPNTLAAARLAMNSEHIYALLLVTNDLLHSIQPELRQVITRLHEEIKKERAGA